MARFREAVMVFAGLLTAPVLTGAVFAQTVAGPGTPDTAAGRAAAPSFRDGQVVEFTGVPVQVRFQASGWVSSIRFGVATRDLTLECFEEGSNVFVLRDLNSRLERIQSWNSRQMLAGGSPVTVRVKGRYGAASSMLWLDEIHLPRVEEALSADAMVWDRFDPDQGDQKPGSAEGVPASSYTYTPEAYEPSGEVPAWGQSPVWTGPPVEEQPTRVYPRVEYEPPASYRVEMGSGGGLRVGDSSIYRYSGPGYSWNDYYNAYYPGLFPPGYGTTDPGGDSGEGAGDEGDGGGDDGESVARPSSGPAVSAPSRAESRAERWGRARRINRRLTNPGGGR